MKRPNYILIIPMVCVLLELMYMINLATVILPSEFTWAFNLILLPFNYDVIPIVDILLVLSIIVSLTIQFLFILWTSMEGIDECYTKGVGYLWVFLAFLGLMSFLLFAGLSEWYSQALKNSPRIGRLFLILGSTIAQISICVLTLGIGVFIILGDGRILRIKRISY